MKTIILATNNRHKAAEFSRYFEEHGFDIKLKTSAEAGFFDEIDETADTFGGNALIKAKALCDFAGETVIADDSGLEVDFLGGAPGVYSSRFSGEHATDAENIEKLLREMKDVPYEKRTAKFVCSICVCRPDGKTLFVTGESNGIILFEKKGSGDFGYDPVFYYPPLDKTFAEMGADEKNEISHRGNAIRELMKHRDFIV